MSPSKKDYEKRYVKPEEQISGDSALRAPCAALVKYLDDEDVPTGRALILGSGLGYDVIHFAKKGFDAFGIDFSQSAVAHAERNASRSKAKCQFACEDFFNLPTEHLGAYDYVFERAFLCQVEPEKRSLFGPIVSSLLKPEGVYVGILWNPDKNPYDREPPYPITLGIIEQTLGKHFRLESLTECPDGIDESKMDAYFCIMRKRNI